MSPGLSDGIRCDVDGNVWSAAGWAGEGFNGVSGRKSLITLVLRAILEIPCICPLLAGNWSENQFARDWFLRHLIFKGVRLWCVLPENAKCPWG